MKIKRIKKELLIKDIDSVINKVQQFLRNYFKRSKRETAIIGISGGVDSSVTAALCVRALGKDRVMVVKMPYKGVSTNHSLKDANLLVKFLALEANKVKEIRINDKVDSFRSLKPDRHRLANIMARVRMIVLYDLANQYNGLVVGTCNKSETLLGYETRYGDGACDLNPIADFYKNQIYQIANFLGLPKSIIIKTPSAELWDGQTDEDELGFSYDWVDILLYLIYDKKISMLDIVDYGYTKDDFKKISQLVLKNRFKQEMPPYFRNQR